MNFEKYASTGNEFLNEVAEELSIPGDKDTAGRILRAVLWTLRARLSQAESFDLIAQLPMMLKAVYVDGWRPGAVPDKHIRNVDDFVEAMMEHADQSALRDFPNPARARTCASAVFRVLKRHVSPGESKDIAGQLPKALQMLWTDA
jgi:uncharacterized protein (DUF2267 family)